VQRFKSKCGLVLLLLTIAGSVQADNTAECRTLIQRLVAVETRLSELSVGADRLYEAQQLADTLAQAKAALDAAKGDSEDAEEKLTELLEEVDDSHPKLQKFLKETAAGTTQFKDALDKTSTNLERARKVLQSGIDASKAKNGADALKAFAEYYKAIKEPLGPLINKVPGVGAFLEAYGAALESASVVVGKLDARREEHRKIGLEITGRDFFNFPSAEDKERKQLIAEAQAINDKLDELDCEDPQDPPEPEIEVTDEQRKKCLERAGAPSDFREQRRRRRRDVRLAEIYRDEAKSTVELTAVELKNAKSRLSNEQNRLKITQTQVKQHRDFMNQYLRSATPEQIKALSPPPLERTAVLVYCDRLAGVTLTQSIKRYFTQFCIESEAYLKAAERIPRRQQVVKELTALAKTNRAELQKREAELKATQARLAEADKWADDYYKCIDEQYQAVKPCREMKLSAEPTPCRCVAVDSERLIWGTYYYTSDSNICTAALHAGVIPKTGGVATVQISPGRKLYIGSSYNGVNSSNYGSFRGSYIFSGVAKPPEADVDRLCPPNMTAYRAKGGAFSCWCSANAIKGSVWGGNPYTDDSSVCAAARHAGVITQRGGAVMVKSVPGQDKYPGGPRNGITSAAWQQWDYSYIVSPGLSKGPSESTK